MRIGFDTKHKLNLFFYSYIPLLLYYYSMIMLFFKSDRKYPIKLKSFKADLAPIGFYFDILSTEVFQIPILPVPMRIDKISNGEPTLFIPLNHEKLEKAFKKYDLRINFPLFYKTGIINLLSYARIKQKEITLRPLENSKVREWWVASNNICVSNPDMVESFTYINTQFLKTFSNIDKNNLDANLDQESYNELLVTYCDSIIKFFRKKIEKNVFFVEKEQNIELDKLYLEKRQKYYPKIIKVAVNDLATKKYHEMGFIPYLIYDDILDSFIYNKKVLENPTNDSINLKVYEHNQIISKTSTIDNIRTKSCKFEFNELKIDEIL